MSAIQNWAEAMLEAKRRWGNDGWAARNEEGRYQVGMLGPHRRFQVRGEAYCGWSDAFEDADSRAAQPVRDSQGEQVANERMDRR